MENDHPEVINIQNNGDSEENSCENTKEISNSSTRFQCSYCSSNYAQKHEENWRLEASSQRSANKFDCPYCENKYSQKHTLKMHVKKKHEENIIRKDVFMNHTDPMKKSKSNLKSELEGKVHENHIFNKENQTSPKSKSKSSHEFNESNLSLNIEENLGKFKCDICTEMFSFYLIDFKVVKI